MAGIIDVHTHAFPDHLAERAMKALGDECDAPAFLDGTIGALLRSMDACGVEKSLICSIATRPSQFDAILAWSQSIASERILPLASIHPADPDPADRAARIAAAGLKGVKLHAYYQEFDVDEERLTPLYQALAREGLVLVMHAGFDPAYPFVDRAGPLRNLRVKERFPDLKLVVGHFGSWKQWDEVAEHLIGKPIHLETSFALDLLPPDVARDMIRAHPPGHVLFGTDSPWRSLPHALSLLRGLGLGAEMEKAILGENARRLLELPPEQEIREHP